jgi:hypothetical protein
MANTKGSLPSRELKTSVSTGIGIFDVPQVNDEQLNKWMKDLYNYRPTEEELKSINELFSYKGFNRFDVLKQLTRFDMKTTTELIILCSMRGPQAASRTPLTNGKTPNQLGIPASGGQGSKILTCNKITAATADLAAFYLKKLSVPKRINIDLPGWLQFPSAGSIKLPADYRLRHLEFAKKFSELIGGTFQEQIYLQMESNSYYDSNLHLFE